MLAIIQCSIKHNFPRPLRKHTLVVNRNSNERIFTNACTNRQRRCIHNCRQRYINLRHTRINKHRKVGAVRVARNIRNSNVNLILLPRRKCNTREFERLLRRNHSSNKLPVHRKANFCVIFCRAANINPCSIHNKWNTHN